MNRLHFDASLWDVANVERAEREWDRLQRATSVALNHIKGAGGPNAELWLLTTLGAGLHTLQDFYSHSNWIEKQGFPGVDGPNWTLYNHGLTPTWFDVPKAARDELNVYVGESTGHKERPHGKWNTEGNRSMAKGVNKDWPGRAGYSDAYTTSYFATRQWVRAIRAALGDEALWTRTLRYGNRRNGQLDHDLKGALRIGMMTGHWQGQGEPCDVGFLACGPQDGLGGDLIGARNVIRDYFEDRGRTTYRQTFQNLVSLLTGEQPAGELLPVASSQGLQAETRFVQMRVMSMKGVGLRALGDPTDGDRADMFSRATIAGQSFQSGEINGRDRFFFPLPYAPFTFIKAIPRGAMYDEPVTTMTVEIRTSSASYSGTDDDVYLRVGPSRRFALDKRLYDDFETRRPRHLQRPDRRRDASGLTVGDISRVQVEKSSDGVGGGWRLRGVKLVVNGRTLYARDSINRWLEDSHRTWRAPDFTPSAPTGPAVPVTLDLWDEDSFVYGDNDHGDINRYDRRKRLALAYVPGAAIDGRATGGSFLSGRLGDGDKAEVRYVIQTLTPVPATPPPRPVIDPGPGQADPGPPDPGAPPPKPDLVISAMDWNNEQGYHFTVTNRGPGNAGPFRVSVSDQGVWAYAGLAAGEVGDDDVPHGVQGRHADGDGGLDVRGRRDGRDEQHAQLHARRPASRDAAAAAARQRAPDAAHHEEAGDEQGDDEEEGEERQQERDGDEAERRDVLPERDERVRRPGRPDGRPAAHRRALQVHGARHERADERRGERRQIGLRPRLPGEEDRPRRGSDDRPRRVQDMVDGRDLVADEVTGGEQPEHDQRGRPLELPERLGQVHDARPRQQRGGEQRQPRVQPRGAGEPERGEDAPDRGGRVHPRRLDRAAPQPALDGDGVARLLADRLARARLHRELVAAVAEGHERALERLVVDGAADLHEASRPEELGGALHDDVGPGSLVLALLQRRGELSQRGHQRER